MFLFHQKIMEPNNPSSKISRFTEHGRGATMCDSGRPSCNYSFTFLQLEELKQQVLIYKYMENSVPVPNNLLLPIYKSVAHSLTDLKGFVGALEHCDYRKNMEPAEPGRCRRTDGKKWRCNKDVARPDQKYCTRHLHRGGGSRSSKQQHISSKK